MDVIRQMQLFVAISEGRSLSSVARSWGVAPSTVSLGLQRLEEQLGVRLVLRSTRQLSLTPDGLRFLERCRRILGEVDEAMQSFSADGPLTGHIRVTCTNDLGRRRIAPLLDEFLRMHPGLTAQLYYDDGLVDLVDSGFDLAVRTGPLPDSDLKARLLVRGRKCVCAAPGYWQLHGRPARPEDLSEHDCILHGTHATGQGFWTFSENGRSFRVRVSGSRVVNDGETLRSWAKAGAGVVMKSSFDIADDIRNGRLETALDNFTAATTNLYAVTPPHGREPRRTRVLIDFLGEKLAGDLPEAF